MNANKKNGLAELRFWLTSFSLFVVMMLVNLPGNAQALCIPNGYGGAYAPGPPAWFQPASTGFARFNTWVDDPRWSGAASVTHGDGANHDVQFRALYAPASGPGQYLYLSWWQKFALNSPSTNNRLYVGLSNGTAGPGLLLKVTFTSNAPTAASASSADIKVHVVNADGTFGSAFSSSPTWTNDVRVWVDQVTDQTTTNPAGATNTTEPGNWAVHVRVPLAANLGDASNNVTLATTFNLWYELLQATSSTPVVAYTWPFPTASKTFLVTTPGGVEQLPPLTDWPQAIADDAQSNSACKGVSLDSTDISVTNSESLPGEDYYISKTVTNTFHAKPINKTGGDLAIGSVHGRFRIANWGIQAGPWDADPATANWNTVRGLGDVSQSGAGNISNGAKWDLSGTWLPQSTNADEAGFFDGTKSKHQCVQVEMFSSSNVPFLRSSAFRNMRTAHASEFKDTAEVSVQGLGTTPAGKRDVFLAVRKFNMPVEVDGTPPKREPVTVPQPPDREAIARAREGGNADQQAEQERFADYTDYERRFMTEPSYVVRGYYDTGKTMNLDSVERPILQPMVAFGYFVNHEGSLTGWKDGLGGLELVGPDFYKVKVPDNSAVPITISIEAKEAKFNWWWLLLILLALLILIWLFKRKPAGP